MFGDGFAIARFHEEAILAMLDLEGNAASSGGDDRDTFMNARVF